MRHVVVAAIAVSLLAIPVGSRADDQAVQSLIGQLRPRAPGQVIVTRGLPKPGAPAAAAPTEQSATQVPVPAAAPAAPPPSPVVASAAADEPSADLNVLFATGSAELTPSAIRLLDDLGRALTDALMGDSRFLIEGHTDTVGSRETNESLSQRRATSVVNYLEIKFHIPTSRLIAKGVGQDGLLVPTPDQTPEQRNRRVHVVNLDG